MTYLCLKTPFLQENLYKLVPIRHEDIYLIMQWRNEQMAILRQNKHLSPDDQEKYFQEVVEPTFKQEKPGLILFSFLYREDCIGYGGLTHIDWAEKRGEVSFLLATERTKNVENYQDEFRIFLSLLKKMAFQNLGFDELFTETYNIRPAHIQVLEEQGFIYQKELKEHTSKDGLKLDSIFHTCRRVNE